MPTSFSNTPIHKSNDKRAAMLIDFLVYAPHACIKREFFHVMKTILATILHSDVFLTILV